MTRMWEHGRLSRRRAVSAAALLIALLCAGWLVWGRPDPAAPSPSASASADIVAAMTASPSPSPTPTATPLASDSADPSASPSASPTQAPKPRPTGLPDLHYHYFGIYDSPNCNWDIHGYIKLYNTGNVTVPAGQVDVLFRVTEGGVTTFETTRTVPVALPPNEQYEIDVTFRFADPCPIELTRTWFHHIDPENKIPESNEDNNTDIFVWEHAHVPPPTPTPPPTASPASSTTGPS